MTLLFATRTDSRFGTGSLYPDFVYELTFPKQMLARPQVPSWQQYNFAGSMTMVFAQDQPEQIGTVKSDIEGGKSPYRSSTDADMRCVVRHPVARRHKWH
jgi:hypothetical protein